MVELPIVSSALPMLAVLLPLVGAPAIYWAMNRDFPLRGSLAALVSLGPLAALAASAPAVFGGTLLTTHLSGLIEFGPHLSLDALSLVFALLAAVIWPAVTIYALASGYPQPGRARFFGTSMITFGATLGVFLSGDILSFFLFFELMTFSAYILLTHRRNRATLLSSYIYLYMGVAGGLALFMAFMLLWHATGTTALVTASGPVILAAGGNPYLIAALLLIGFGSKAGMIGLHVWLPSTYVRSPFPATAMFSAVMSKAGIYGLLRFLTLVLGHSQSGDPLAMNLGWMVLWPGLATMIGGAVMAIRAHSVKRLLAFSSMSQMGYMLVGVGTVLAMGQEGALAASGTIIHAVNHALFKTILFLLVGTLAVSSRSYLWSALKGKGRALAAIPLTIAALGVAGVPGLSGFVSKTLIHEGLEEAYYLYHLTHLHWAEYAFVLGSALTAAYYVKLLTALLGSKPPRWLASESQNAARAGLPDHFDPPPSLPQRSRLLPSWMGPLTLAVLSGAVVVFGVYPRLLVGFLGVTSVAPYGFSAYDVSHLLDVPFFGGHALEASAKALSLGAVLYVLYTVGFSRIMIPVWLSLERFLVVMISHSNRFLSSGIRLEYLSMASYFAAEDESDRRDDERELDLEGGDFQEPFQVRAPNVPGWMKGMTGPGMAERLTAFLGQARPESSERSESRRSDLEMEGLEGETGDYEGDLINISRPRTRRQQPTLVRSTQSTPGRRASATGDLIIRRLLIMLDQIKEKWQGFVTRLPLPDQNIVNTRNLNFAALMIAVLSTLTLVYLVSRTRLGP